jgi:hypothetical protein
MAQGYAYDPTIALGGNNAVAKYGSVTAVPSTEILIVSYTVPTGSTAIVKGVFGEGGTDGLFKLYVNSVSIWEDRNAWTQRGIQSFIEKTLASGDIVDLKVTNQKTVNHVFTGGFYVYEL